MPHSLGLSVCRRTVPGMAKIINEIPGREPQVIIVNDEPGISATVLDGVVIVQVPEHLWDGRLRVDVV